MSCSPPQRVVEGPGMELEIQYAGRLYSFPRLRAHNKSRVKGKQSSRRTIRSWSLNQKGPRVTPALCDAAKQTSVTSARASQRSGRRVGAGGRRVRVVVVVVVVGEGGGWERRAVVVFQALRRV